jgi:hypothetical protein
LQACRLTPAESGTRCPDAEPAAPRTATAAAWRPPDYRPRVATRAPRRMEPLATGQPPLFAAESECSRARSDGSALEKSPPRHSVSSRRNCRVKASALELATSAGELDYWVRDRGEWWGRAGPSASSPRSIGCGRIRRLACRMYQRHPDTGDRHEVKHTAWGAAVSIQLRHRHISFLTPGLGNGFVAGRCRLCEIRRRLKHTPAITARPSPPSFLQCLHPVTLRSAGAGSH